MILDTAGARGGVGGASSEKVVENVAVHSCAIMTSRVPHREAPRGQTHSCSVRVGRALPPARLLTRMLPRSPFVFYMGGATRPDMAA